ncbi:MAG: hypothetical protein AABY15_00235 [Nanoarchaeota archaeon]
MDLSWENVTGRKTWASLTEEERADIVLHMKKTSYTLEEVRILLEEQRKFIASRFEGPVTLISNKVCSTRILSSHEYELNLRLAARIKENELL